MLARKPSSSVWPHLVMALAVLVLPLPAVADGEKCRAAILTASARYSEARMKTLARCEDRVLTGRLAADTVCVDEPATSLRIEKAAAKLRQEIDRACGGADRACGVGGDDVDLVAAGWGIGSCRDLAQNGCAMPVVDCADVASCVTCVGNAATTEPLNLLTAEMDPNAPKSREVLGCQRAAVKQFAKLLGSRIKLGSRCWGKVLKGKAVAPCPVPGDGRTAVSLDAATSKFVTSVCRACGGADRECDADVGAAPGSGGGDDLAPAALGAASVCPARMEPVSGDSCGGVIASVSDYANCAICAASFSTSCAALATVPADGDYPAACNDAIPTPTPSPTPAPTPVATATPPATGLDYFVDGLSGDDGNIGTNVAAPWRTLEKVSGSSFQPGDRILFKRGSQFTGCVTIYGDGTEGAPITISAYGAGEAPAFSNPDHSTCNGNAMRIRGDYQVVEDLYFHHTAPAPDDSGFVEVWAVGALHVSLGNDHVVIRNNEFANIPKAIQSYSQHSLITENYIHDTNLGQSNGMLSDPWWGPVGIQLGIGNQEVSYNVIENMYAIGGEFGADGGAIEVDDGRNHKDNIHIHHNRTSRNMGFTEISWWDDIQKMASTNVSIHHNTSRDFQSFVLWWAPTSASMIENNTIIRTDNEYTGPFDGVFFMDARPADIRLTKNIVVTDGDLTESIFIEGFDGGVEDVDHFDNLYWHADGGVIELGLPLGPGEVLDDPLFVDWIAGDYRLHPSSPATGWGAWDGD